MSQNVTKKLVTGTNYIGYVLCFGFGSERLSHTGAIRPFGEKNFTKIESVPNPKAKYKRSKNFFSVPAGKLEQSCPNMPQAERNRFDAIDVTKRPSLSEFNQIFLFSHRSQNNYFSISVQMFLHLRTQTNNQKETVPGHFFLDFPFSSSKPL